MGFFSSIGRALSDVSLDTDKKIKDADITSSNYHQYKKEIDNFSLEPDSDFFDDDESSFDSIDDSFDKNMTGHNGKKS